MANSPNKTQMQQDDGKLLAGLQNHQATLPASWNLMGTAYTLVQILAILTTRLAKAAAVQQAKVAYASALLAAKQEAAASKPVIDAVRQQLRVWCANAPDALDDYGMAVAKPKGGVKSPVTKVLAAAKAKSTRAARGTKGALEASKIAGTVPPAVTINTQTQEVSAGATAPAQPPAAAATPTAGTPHPPTSS